MTSIKTPTTLVDTLASLQNGCNQLHKDVQATHTSIADFQTCDAIQRLEDMVSGLM